VDGEITEQMKSACLISIILILLSACIKKDNLYTEEISGNTAENENTLFVKEEQKELIDMDNDNNLSTRDELIELIKKVTFPEAPDSYALQSAEFEKYKYFFGIYHFYMLKKEK
jgi:hypothetical protein